MPGNRGMTYMKKDCNGCKAIKGSHTCMLGYSVQRLDMGEGHPRDNEWAPTEPCPKPRTYERLNDLLSAIDKDNRGAE
jgi:hypothetical protein